MVRATSPQGRQRAATLAATFALPRAAPAAKKVGSLSPPAPLSCGAPLRRARGGHARRSLASLFRSGRGKSVLSRVWCSVSGKSPITTLRGLRPLRERRCA